MVSCFCGFVPFGQVMSLCEVGCALPGDVTCGEVCASPAGDSMVIPCHPVGRASSAKDTDRMFCTWFDCEM